MRLFASVAVVSLALAASVSAQPVSTEPAAQPTTETPAPSAKAEKGKAKKNKDGVICHKELPTGSRLPIKVCTTAEERRGQRSSAQRAQESMQAPSQVVPQ